MWSRDHPCRQACGPVPHPAPKAPWASSCAQSGDRVPCSAPENRGEGSPCPPALTQPGAGAHFLLETLELPPAAAAGKGRLSHLRQGQGCPPLCPLRPHPVPLLACSQLPAQPPGLAPDKEGRRGGRGRCSPHPPPGKGEGAGLPEWGRGWALARPRQEAGQADTSPQPLARAVSAQPSTTVLWETQSPPGRRCRGHPWSPRPHLSSQAGSPGLGPSQSSPGQARAGAPVQHLHWVP